MHVPLFSLMKLLANLYQAAGFLPDLIRQAACHSQVICCLPQVGYLPLSKELPVSLV